jgi:HAD superfamily hydrolase (TIGR01509 family)
MATTFTLDDTRGLIFDCDGTLLDTIEAWNESEANTVAMTGVEWSQVQLEELRAAPLNEGARMLHERYGVGSSAQEVLEIIDAELIGFYREKAVSKPGAVELLREAQTRGIPCVVVTSSPQRYVMPAFERCGLDGYFKRVITTDDAGISKQDPRIWELALDVLGCGAQESWGFEDSIYALKVMNQVGIRSVGCYDCDETGTYEQLSAEAMVTVRSLEELL